MSDDYKVVDGNARPITLVDYLDDTDPYWRFRLSDQVLDRILAGGYMSLSEAEGYLVDYYGD